MYGDSLIANIFRVCYNFLELNGCVMRNEIIDFMFEWWGSILIRYPNILAWPISYWG
jgi:hypothetical protein